MDFRYYPLCVRAYVTEGFTIPSEDTMAKADKDIIQSMKTCFLTE